MKLRQLEPTDRSEWEGLWTAYLDFYETSVSREVYDTAFARLTAGSPGEYQGLVIERDGHLVGLAHFLFHRNLWTVEDTCYLMDLFVAPDLRGQGVGRRLIEAVSEAARDAGVPSVYWMTQEFNYRGRMLYDQVAEKTPFLVYERSSSKAS